MGRMSACILAVFCAFGLLLAQGIDEGIKSIDERGAAEILAAHNRYRGAIGLDALEWSNELALEAQRWADYLAKHNGRKIYGSGSVEQGENIWWGSSNAYTFAQMVDCWGSEEKDFSDGVYPAVSKTGKPDNVSHYTQMVWKTTTHVGCAKAVAGQYDILVCRYSPRGNIAGEKPF